MDEAADSAPQDLPAAGPDGNHAVYLQQDSIAAEPTGHCADGLAGTIATHVATRTIAASIGGAPVGVDACR